VKKLGHILARYTAWVLGLMKVLGIWGVFVIAFADSALIGMPVDFVVATYVHQDRKRMLLYVAMAALGSALAASLCTSLATWEEKGFCASASQKSTS
jgi:membrane protein YqaA with SNARE-associated domain